MKSILRYCFFILLMTTALVAVPQDTLKPVKVYMFKIREMIAPPVWHHTKKAFKEAADLNADIILIDMNTYGGMLDAADSIRTVILDSKIPVYVFINKNAASAGALISIACDSIYMAPGSGMGAATVVDSKGEVLPDKYQSYMRSMMRATAEAKGRNPDIAQAMVDPAIYVKGVSDSGKVLTFTPGEAIKNHFCEAEVASFNEALAHAGITNYTLEKQQLTAADKITGFLINPMISGVLIMIIIGGIYFELQTPGIGFPLAAAVTAALLYFAPLYIEGLANHWEILLFIAGLVLLAMEIFAIPGFGVTGFAGIMLMVSGLTLSLVEHIGPGTFDYNYNKLVKAFFLVIISMTGGILVSIFLARKLLESPKLGFALVSRQLSSDGFTVAEEGYRSMVGKTGVAQTQLRPAGKVLIDNDVFDAVSQVSFIEKNQPVKVVDYKKGQLIVRKAQQ
jgi:membrane-bound serine protease (ClpP class)